MSEARTPEEDTNKPGDENAAQEHDQQPRPEDETRDAHSGQSTPMKADARVPKEET